MTTIGVAELPPFSRSALADHHRWLAKSADERVRLQQSYPSRDAAIEAMEYGDYVARREAIVVLGALGDHAAVLHYALIERESEWMPMLASRILVQPPLELLIHWITQLKPGGNTSYFKTAIEFELPEQNYAHVGDGFALFLRKEKRRFSTLKYSQLVALGHSGIAAVAPLLTAFLAVDRLQTFREALDAGLPRKQCIPFDGVDFPGEEHRYLDHASHCALAAAFAIRSLGGDLDIERIRDWLAQLERLAAATPRFVDNDLIVQLRWILFDAGDDSQFSWFLDHAHCRARDDVRLSLLRRGEYERFDQLLARIPDRFESLRSPTNKVKYWPIVDYLHSTGVSCWHTAGHNYLFARSSGAPAPMGWRWLSHPDDD